MSHLASPPRNARQRLNIPRQLPVKMGSTRRDYALILLASVLWGTSFPGSKLTVGTVDPLFLTFARMGLGAALAVTVLVGLRRLDPKMFHEPIVWMLGAINAIGFDLDRKSVV